MRLSFMGQGQPEELRGRVYDGTGAEPSRWWCRAADGKCHVWAKRDARTLCGLPVGNGEVGELEPGSDFGVGATDCQACAEGVRP